MKTTVFFIIMIIFIFIFITLFLGTTYYEGYTNIDSMTTSIQINSKVFYAGDGTQATLIVDDNNNIDSIIITNPQTGTTTVFTPNSNYSNNVSVSKTVSGVSNGTNLYYVVSTTYTDQNGNTATITKGSAGNVIITVTNATTGVVTVYTNSVNTNTTNTTSSTNNNSSNSSTNNTTTSSTNSTTATVSSIQINSKVFYAPDGTQATLIVDDNNNIDSIIITNPQTGTSVFIPNNYSNNVSVSKTATGVSSGSNLYYVVSTTYTDQNGNTATITNGSGGNVLITVTNATTGVSTVYTNVMPNNQYTNSYNYSGYTNYPNYTNDNASSYTTYTNENTNNNVDANSITSTSPTQPVIVTNYDSSSYYNSKQGYNNGIPASQIPNGSEDLYILKSQVIPPVCPVCPPSLINTCEKQGKCPPCPAPQRCPSESDFICKKQPNYQYNNIQKNLPQPVLNSFSSFGM